MRILLLIVLAGVWAALLVPPLVRSRRDNRPSGSIHEFRRQLHVLGRTSPAGIASLRGGARRPAGPSRRCIKRRRDVLVGLLVVMGASLLLGFIPVLRVAWAVHVVADLAFVAYIGALVHFRNLAAEREAKVRFLPRPARVESALLLHSSAN